MIPDVKLDATEVYVLPFGLNELEFPPFCVFPQVTTLPSFFNAANTLSFEYMDTTPDVKLDATEVYVLLLGLNELAIPPYGEFPHTTTLPSFFSAAKA
jgi:hypothetical protein